MEHTVADIRTILMKRGITEFTKFTEGCDQLLRLVTRKGNSVENLRKRLKSLGFLDTHLTSMSVAVAWNIKRIKRRASQIKSINEDLAKIRADELAEQAEAAIKADADDEDMEFMKEMMERAATERAERERRRNDPACKTDPPSILSYLPKEVLEELITECTRAITPASNLNYA